MLRENTREKVLLILSLVGFLLAALVGMTERADWLDVLCTSGSKGCRETAGFSMAWLPLWSWGLMFYGVLVITLTRARKWVPCVVSAGMGVEISLVWLLYSKKLFCVFCMGNLAVMLLLVFLVFDGKRVWEMVSFCLLFLWLSSSLLVQASITMASVSGESPEKAPVAAAEVAGQVITMEELEAPFLTRVHEMQQEIYRLKKQRLDQMVADLLLYKEAQALGISVQDLVSDEVLSKTPMVTDAEVDGYLEENRGRMADWKGTEEELKDRVRTYLQQQRNLQAVMKFSKSLESKYGVVVHLKEPSPPRTRVDLAGSPSLGPADAPVTIVEFSDYQCPACRQVHEVVLRMRAKYGTQLQWVFKDYPLKMHKDAERVAEAAHCAGDQQKFWEYQNALYASTEELSTERLQALAARLGLAPEPFKACLDEGKYRAKVQKGLEDAKKAGVDRTPTFLINGKMYRGAFADERFSRLIEEELKSVGREPRDKSAE